MALCCARGPRRGVGALAAVRRTSHALDDLLRNNSACVCNAPVYVQCAVGCHACDIIPVLRYPSVGCVLAYIYSRRAERILAYYKAG